MTDNYKLCPFCKKGEMRIHRRVTKGDANNIEKSENNQWICDMCGKITEEANLTEKPTEIKDDLGMKIKRKGEKEFHNP